MPSRSGFACGIQDDIIVVTNFIRGDKRAGGLLHLMIGELTWTGMKPEWEVGTGRLNETGTRSGDWMKPEREVGTERNRNEKWGLNETGKAGENKSARSDYL